MAYKRTSKSSNGGRHRTTITKTRNGVNKSTTQSTSNGAGRTRVTTTVNLSTGAKKSYMTQTSSDGYRHTTSLSGKSDSAYKKTKVKTHVIRSRKSKPISWKYIFWIVCTLMVFHVISK